MANLRTKIPDFRGVDSSIILIVRVGILMFIGNFPEVLSQAILVGIILVGRLGVPIGLELAGPPELAGPLGSPLLLLLVVVVVALAVAVAVAVAVVVVVVVVVV